MWLRVLGLGCWLLRVLRLGFGFRVLGFDLGLGLRVLGFGLEFGVLGFGIWLRVLGLRLCDLA